MRRAAILASMILVLAAPACAPAAAAEPAAQRVTPQQVTGPRAAPVGVARPRAAATLQQASPRHPARPTPTRAASPPAAASLPASAPSIAPAASAAADRVAAGRPTARLAARSTGRGSAMRHATHAHPGLGDSDFPSSAVEAHGMCGQMLMPAAALREVSRGFQGGHAGIDLMAPHGSPARAAAAGSVIYAGWYYAYGNIVDLRHSDGVVTRYAHLSSIGPEITPGVMVLAGDEIGKVGATGRASGPHIHFEVRLGGRPVDPRPYLALANCTTPGASPEILEAYADERAIRRPRQPTQ